MLSQQWLISRITHIPSPKTIKSYQKLLQLSAFTCYSLHLIMATRSLIKILIRLVITTKKTTITQKKYPCKKKHKKNPTRIPVSQWKVSNTLTHFHLIFNSTKLSDGFVAPALAIPLYHGKSIVFNHGLNRNAWPNNIIHKNSKRI